MKKSYKKRNTKRRLSKKKRITRRQRGGGAWWQSIKASRQAKNLNKEAARLTKQTKNLSSMQIRRGAKAKIADANAQIKGLAPTTGPLAANRQAQFDLLQKQKGQANAELKKASEVLKSKKRLKEIERIQKEQAAEVARKKAEAEAKKAAEAEAKKATAEAKTVAVEARKKAQREAKEAAAARTAEIKARAAGVKKARKAEAETRKATRQAEQQFQSAEDRLLKQGKGPITGSKQNLKDVETYNKYKSQFGTPSPTGPTPVQNLGGLPRTRSLGEI